MPFLDTGDAIYTLLIFGLVIPWVKVADEGSFLKTSVYDPLNFAFHRAVSLSW